MKLSVALSDGRSDEGEIIVARRRRAEDLGAVQCDGHRAPGDLRVEADRISCAGDRADDLVQPGVAAHSAIGPVVVEAHPAGIARQRPARAAAGKVAVRDDVGAGSRAGGEHGDGAEQFFHRIPF